MGYKKEYMVVKEICAHIIIAGLLCLIAPSSKASAEYSFSSKMPMHVVYPRPDCETKKFARHRLAHTGMPYEIPVGVQGGAWPFTYKLIEGPDGATIGENVDDAKYGVVSWQPKANDSGERTFRVRVRDKVGNNTDLTWTVTIDNNQFVFIQDGYSGIKKGTLEQPLEDVSDWYMGDRNNKKYHNKIIVFRGGEYLLIGGEDTNGNIRLDANSKSRTLIGYPGEVAELDASKAKIFTDLKSLTDLFVADLTFKNSRQDVNNAQFFWAIGNTSRATWWRNRFVNHGMGKKGNDNPAGVFVSDTKFHKENILYKDNFHDQFNNGRGNGSYVDIYYSSYVLIEENYARNSDNKCGFWAKGTTSYVSIRNNEAYDNITSGGICVGYGKESPKIPHDHEIAWNRIVLNGQYESAMSLQFANQDSWAGKHYNSYIYRNTFVGGRAWVRFPGKNKYFVDANVLVSEKGWNKSIMRTTHENLVGSKSDYITDSTGKLAGFALDFKGAAGFQLNEENE